MKPNELRVGNWVLCNGYPIKITGIVAHNNRDRVYDDFRNDWSLDRITTIPLTEELLLKLGFERIDSGHSEDHEDSHQWLEKVYPIIGCVYSGDGDYVFCEKFDDQHIYSLHQLQNLYFTITGEELEIKL